jgi:hypothetical protein
VASEDQNREGANLKDTTREPSFDVLAKGLADGTVSRGRALRLLGGALFGGMLTSIAGIASAQDRGQGKGPPNSPRGRGTPPESTPPGHRGTRGCPAGHVRVRGECVCPPENRCDGQCCSASAEACQDGECINVDEFCDNCHATGGVGCLTCRGDTGPTNVVCCPSGTHGCCSPKGALCCPLERDHCIVEDACTCCPENASCVNNECVEVICPPGEFRCRFTSVCCPEGCICNGDMCECPTACNTDADCAALGEGVCCNGVCCGCGPGGCGVCCNGVCEAPGTC